MDQKQLAIRLLESIKSLSHMPFYKSADVFASGERFVLSYLYQHGSAMPKQLSEAMMASTAYMAKLLGILEHKGLIVRDIDRSDRRKIIVVLTEQGTVFIKSEMEKALKIAMDILSDLGEEDAAEGVRILEKLVSIKQAKVKTMHRKDCAEQENIDERGNTFL